MTFSLTLNVYTSEYSDSLDDPAWVPLSSLPGTGSTLLLADPAPDSPQRSYRLRVQ